MYSQLKAVYFAFMLVHHSLSCNFGGNFGGNSGGMHCPLFCDVNDPCFSSQYVKTKVDLLKVNIPDNSTCTEIKFRKSIINFIDINAFKGLEKILVADLCCNQISVLNSEVFKDLKSLKELNLKENQLCSLSNRTFKHLSLLEWLDLGKNCMKELNGEMFFGLRSLQRLYLGHNMLHIIKNGTFKYLISLQHIDLSRNSEIKFKKDHFNNLKILKSLILIENNLKTLTDGFLTCLKSLQVLSLNNNYLSEIYFYQFADMPSIKEIAASRNMIHRCAFSYVSSLEIINLFGNNLTHVDTKMFAGLTNLRELVLGYNSIKQIEDGAFRDLGNLTTLNLNKNILTCLSPESFIGLFSLKYLSLDQNPIHNIEENTFGDIVSAEKTTKIDLRSNRISELKWTVFVSSHYNLSQKEISIKNLKLYTSLQTLQCKRSHCWLRHMQWRNILGVIVNMGICKESKHACFSRATWCMDLENNSCEAQCQQTGKAGGKLVIDGDVCPFQYYCKCTCSSCEQKCASQGKIHITKYTNKYGCSICNCQCDKSLNCWRKCKGDNFHVQNSTFGCPECKCRCAKLDCDANCTGEGLGIVGKDQNGCQVCNGCKDMLLQGETKALIHVVLPVLIFITATILLVICGTCFQKRQHIKEQDSAEVFNTTLNILTKHLDPKLAVDVKESWCDPNSLHVQQLLGNGHFGLVWAGTFKTLSDRKYPAAIKVAKAEFKEVWRVQTKWNDKHELKAHFQKRPIQMKLNNQVIEDLLTEAVTMKKFNHPNVLKIFGISVYEEKPCIILPLMSNGDLKKYLITNKLKISVQQLTAFALGVAKGMAHLAEKNFVHSDLAARNCLLDLNLVIKISDFGLAKNVHDGECCKTDSSEKPMPVRWMSIETFQQKIFTLQSDVWSFGVVLWEIYCYGELPYTCIGNMDVMKYLLNGKRLEKPVLCPENLYKIMQKCWNDDPAERPGFNTIIDMLNKITDTEANYTEITDGSECI